MANTRPDIFIQPSVDNDIYALLNAQAGQPSVTVGDKLRIQNKSGLPIYIHQTDQAVTDFVGGTRLPVDWQLTTDDAILGCKASVVSTTGRLQVEVLT